MARTTVATDAFTRTDASSLGSDWTDTNDNWGTSDIASNNAVGAGSGGGGQSAYWSGSGSWTDNQYAGVQVGATPFSGASTWVGPTVRNSTGVNGARDHYAVRVIMNSPGPTFDLALVKLVNDTPTTLDTEAVAVSVGDWVWLEAEGDGSSTDLRVFVNSTQISALNTTDASTPLTGGNAGLITSGDAADSIINQWEGGNITGAGASGKPYYAYAQQ